VIAGAGECQVEPSGITVRIAAVDVARAAAGAVHCVLNTGLQALVIVSVVSSVLSGFEPL
jgi:oxalate decarboxylase/phosphoglucose isomerase-like protein (cupin superfamily)